MTIIIFIKFRTKTRACIREKSLKTKQNVFCSTKHVLKRDYYQNTLYMIYRTHKEDLENLTLIGVIVGRRSRERDSD